MQFVIHTAKPEQALKLAKHTCERINAYKPGWLQQQIAKAAHIELKAEADFYVRSDKNIHLDISVPGERPEMVEVMRAALEKELKAFDAEGFIEVI